MCRKPLIEMYWIHQLKNDTKRITAARRLSELKCYRAIPDIVDAFSKKLELDQDLFIGYSAMNYSSQIDPRIIQKVKLHPMLFAVYSMGSEGSEYLKPSVKKYSKILSGVEKHKQRQLNRFGRSHGTRFSTLYEALKFIDDAWNRRKDIEVTEGSEKNSEVQIPAFPVRL